MPELQGKQLDAFNAVDVDLNTIPYKDAKMEQQRRAKRAASEQAKKQGAEYDGSFRVALMFYLFIDRSENDHCLHRQKLRLRKRRGVKRRTRTTLLMMSKRSCENMR